MNKKNPSISRTSQLRVSMAIFICRFCRRLLRFVGRGGTSLPGKIALAISPNLLTVLSSDVRTVVVSGTNGKTTTCGFISTWLKSSRLLFFANSSGANLLEGIAAEFADNVALNQPKDDLVAVIECDEAALRLVLDQIKPEVIVLTNVFRDQLDRYGEVTQTLLKLKAAVQKTPQAVLCLNADDSLIASIAEEVPNPIIFYGIDSFSATAHTEELSDAPYCIKCGHRYSYIYVTYAHLGGFHCSKCGYRRPVTDIAVKRIVKLEADRSIVELRCNNKLEEKTIPLPATYNIYNYLAATAALNCLNISVPSDEKQYLASSFGRMEHFSLGAGITMVLVKNPAGFTQVLDYLSMQIEEYDLMICLNDRVADGKDISWIWDVPLERLISLAYSPITVYVSGTRKEDMLLRLKYAGVSEQRLKAVRIGRFFTPSNFSNLSRPLIILPTYTAMMDLRRRLSSASNEKNFWE